VNAVDVAMGEDVERAAESGVRVEGIDLVSGSDVDVDGGVGAVCAKAGASASARQRNGRTNRLGDMRGLRERAAV